MWEIVKQIEKNIIMILLYYFNGDITMRACSIVLILVVYIIILNNA